jgi:hypothetical protein
MLNNKAPLPDGLMRSNFIGYAFYTAPDSVIQSKIEIIQASINRRSTPEDVLTAHRGWEMTGRYFFFYDAVNIVNFIVEFDHYSYRCLSGKSHAFMTETENDSAARDLEIAKRRDELILALKKAAREKSDIFFAGAESVADDSVDGGDCKNIAWKHLVWLDIKKLSFWFVQQSDLPVEWIPFPIRAWVKDHAPDPLPPSAPAVPPVQAGGVEGKEGKETSPAVTQKQMAELCGVNERTIRYWESKDRKPPAGYSAGLRSTRATAEFWAEQYVRDHAERRKATQKRDATAGGVFKKKKTKAEIDHEDAEHIKEMFAGNEGFSEME